MLVTPPRAHDLRQDQEFLKLWVGQTVSTFGSGVTASVLPLTAVLVLGASATDMGWLVALESAPALLVGMFAGVLVGGFLGDAIGLRPTLLVAAGGIILGAAWLVRSPIDSGRISETGTA